MIGSAPVLIPDLIKPGVARFGQRLDEIQRAAIALFPIVKSRLPMSIAGRIRY